MTNWAQYKGKRVRITTENLTVEGFVMDAYPWHHNDPVFQLDVSGTDRVVVHLIEGAKFTVEDLTPVVSYKDLLLKQVQVTTQDGTQITGRLTWVPSFNEDFSISGGNVDLEMEIAEGIMVQIEVGSTENAYIIEEVQ